MAETHRHLAAIMFTDIVGFTTLMRKQESRALQIVSQNNEIHSNFVKQYAGKWHKDLGDGTLSSFSSSVSAVECAIAIQRVVNAEPEYKLRIGIHLGDVTFKNGDVLGDGVNVASRIESEAADGGICLSESIVESIVGNESIKTEYIGKKKLKNVHEPTRLYQVVTSGVLSKRKVLVFNKSIVLFLFIASLVIASAVLSWTLKEFPNKTVMRYSIYVPEGLLRVTDIALSNDGTMLTYGANVKGTSGAQMYVRSMNSFESQIIQDGAFIDDPVFSLDDRELAFGSRGSIKAYSFETDRVFSIGKIVSLQINGLTWINDSVIYAPGIGNSELAGNLMSISRDNQKNNLFIAPDLTKLERDLLNPFFITSFNSLLFQVNSSLENKIWIIDLESGVKKDVIRGENPKYITTGHLIFKDGENLMGSSFDPKNPETIGDPIRLIAGVEGDLYSLSSEGTLAYVPSIELNRQPIFVDKQGNQKEIPIPEVFWSGILRMSPDNSKILFRNPATNSLWIYDLERQSSQLLISHISNTAQWSPNGTSVVFRAGQGEEILMVDIFDTETIDTLVINQNNIYPVSFSSDGNLMFYDEIHSLNQKNIYIYNFEEDRSYPFMVSEADESMAQLSPDGNLIVYCSNETGDFEIYLKRYPDTGEKWLISVNGGTEPLWQRKGNELYYKNGNRLMKVSITPGENLDYGKPEVVFEGPYLPSPYGITNYDITSDGEQFLMLKPVNTKRPEIRIVTNWIEELKDKISE